MIVDLLIDADMYWSIVSGVVKKDDYSGLVAISSKLGWLVSGPVSSNGEVGISTNLMHVFKIECNPSEGDTLLNNFGELDILGIKRKKFPYMKTF